MAVCSPSHSSSGDWPVRSLYGVAAALVLLLFVGIHNAWDIAVWNSLRKPDEPGSKQDEPSTNP